MRFRFGSLLLTAELIQFTASSATITAEQAAQLPPPANHQVDFSKEIKPIFESSCTRCHGRGKAKGGFQLDDRNTFLKGGDSGPAVISGKSSQSLVISLVAGLDPDSIMPKKGSRLTPKQVGLLRAWIDQGISWDAGISFGRLEPANLKRRLPTLPPGDDKANAIDRFLEPYFASHNFKPPAPVDDRLFARRVFLDAIGLLPPPDALERFVSDRGPDKRVRLIETLLADERNYAEHWLTFWNDLLRNDYKGTGYIDGGRKQITGWLYSALRTNMPYNQFVAELISPRPESEGFTKGIVWRGVVNASQTPQMQAAQSICQVFMGVNLKCASCHDSFVNDLTLADSYGLAGIYADGPLEMVQCDKPTGKKAELKFIYPELGPVEAQADKSARLKSLANLITQPQDGRLTRTLVNRLWQRFLGRGLIEPADDMEKAAWNTDLLDWLAEDFASHNYDVRFLIRRILTSTAYQLPSVNFDEKDQTAFVFQGPLVRRMSAEQFRDALTSLTGLGYSSPAAEVTPSESEAKRFALPVQPRWLWNTEDAAEKAKPGHVYFRKSVALSSIPEDATAAVVCDNSFTLFVNGKEVGSGNEFKTTFVFELRRWLKAGTNLFAIDAVNHLKDNSLPNATNVVAGTENPAGLLFYARLRHGDSPNTITNDVISDRSWICSDQKQPGWQASKFDARMWRPATDLGDIGMQPWRASKENITTKLAAAYPGKVRAALVAADPLLLALGRPNREQVVTTRPSEATTLQAVEMTNGETLADLLSRGAQHLLNDSKNKNALLKDLCQKAFGRKPTSKELETVNQLAGAPPRPDGLADALWVIAMLPEFQLIY